MFLLNWIKDLKSKLMVALTSIALLSILGFGLAAYFSERDALAKNLRAELTATADFEKRQIISWLSESRADTRMLAINKSNRSNLDQLLFLENLRHQPNLAREIVANYQRRMATITTLLTNNLISLQKSRLGYSRIVMLDKHGRVRVTTDPALNGQFLADDIAFQRTLGSADGIYIRDFYPQSSAGAGQYAMDFGYVIDRDMTTGSPDADQIIGVVLITVDVDQALFPLLRGWRMGDTGEVLLGASDKSSLLIINREQVLANEASDMPLLFAEDGREDTVEMIDYKQTAVLAAYRQLAAAEIPGIRWDLVIKMDAREIYAPLYGLISHLGLIAAVILSIAAFVSLLIARTLSNPLAQLVHATQSVAAGDLKTQIDVKRTDEIGALASAFEKMIDALAQRQRQVEAANGVVQQIALENARLVEQLQWSNADLEIKISERTRDLAEANVQLKKLDLIKSAFLLNVSHELRNPVTSLKFNLDLLQRELVRTNNISGKGERYMATLTKHLDLLARIIEDMLNLLHLEQEGNSLERTLVDLDVVVSATLLDYRTRIEASDLTLIYTPTLPLPRIKADPARLAQMLACVLNNAIAYNRMGGQIRLSIDANAPGFVGIKVEDTGMGISSEDIEHIFERFYRGMIVNESAIPGTGLGLSIVKEIVTLHGGQIEVKSQLGKGTILQIWLPTDVAQVSVDSAPQEENSWAQHGYKWVV